MKEKLIHALLTRDIQSTIEGMCFEHNDEITNEVRESLDTLPIEEIKEIQSFLYKLLNICYDGQLFEMNLEKKENEIIANLNSKAKFLLKESLIYFIGRLKISPNIEVLKKIYQLDDDKYIKLNVTFATLQTFDEEVELDFITKLIPGSAYDEMIRSWTIAFFKKENNPYEYKDNNTDDWTVAKLPRIKRLSINDSNSEKYKKAMAYRLLDLMVIYLFLENRKTDTLTSKEKEIISNAIIDYEKYSPKKKELLKETKKKILQRS